MLALTVSQAVAPAAAAAGDIGFEGPSFTGSGSAPTGSKPESKLWFNDGLWWGTLWSTSAAAFHIYRLDLVGQQWVDTGVAIDKRTGTRDDVLWDGSKLYIASHRYSTSPAPGYPVLLYRYSYVAASKTYTLDAGFPATIHDSKTETFVIDKDSTGRLWATWVQNQQVYISHSTTSDATWTTPFVLPVSGTSVDVDDISSVIAFRHTGDPNRIGVMWSNQLDDKVHFAFHNDGDPDTAWDDSKTAIQGNNYADDHINLKSVQSDGSGRIYAAIKTSLSTSSAPLIMLLTFTPATMTWTNTPVGRVSDGHTRPIVMIDEEHSVAHVYMTGPVPPATSGDSGGAIYEKTASLSNLTFPLGLGTAVIQDADSPAMNNATSTKQNVTSASGLVILASNDSTNRYWWQFDPVGGTPPPVNPPVADFTASPTSGPAPLAVQFTDQSTNFPTSWAWDFDNNGSVDSTAQNPSFTYTTPGSYSVSLRATNGGGSDTATKTSLITVGQPLSFTTLNPAADAYVNQGQATKNYGTDPSLRVRQSANSYRSYLKFSVPSLSGTVRSVKLRLWVTDASPDGGSVYSVANTWTESGTGSITWNTAPPLPGTAIKAIGATAVSTWEEIDLGPVVSGAGTYSFAIASSSGNSAYYSSREGAHAPELVIGVDGGEPPPPAPPVAAFSASPTSGDAPLLVQFTDQSTNAPTSWAWDFQDDGTVDSTVKNPSFSYTTAGSYTVKLTVTNTDGSDSVTKSDLISVGVAPPPPPTTTFTAIADTRVSQASPTSKTGGTDVSLRVRLDATGSYHTYVRFNVTGISGTITSVKLRLWCTDASPNGGTAYPTSGAWDEATTSWSNAPAATGGALASSGAVAAGAWAEFDVTTLVTANGQVDLLVADGDTNSAYYSSREGTDAPQLVVATSP
ncbi:MAG TPA: DNRLRE domain-containing protein [Candidatus Limnocylindrales bacterium]|nr:DNRLRE domain-containing protein [Candidatus Limnocylindrales bacterium]